MSEFDAPVHVVRALVATALAEDIGPLGDLTAALLPSDARAAIDVVARADGVARRHRVRTRGLAQLDAAVQVQWLADDGDVVAPGTKVGEVAGPLRSVLTGERSALNFLCHLSGVASLTRRFVEAAGPTARIWDTRKTLPGLRAVEKAAVRAGGGVNHRGSLSEFVLVKDNHLAGLGITEAVRRAHARWPGRTVEVECDRAEQVQEAIARRCHDGAARQHDARRGAGVRVAGARHRARRASWSRCRAAITLDTVRAYADAGADLISTSVITQSAPALDLAFDLRPDAPTPGRADMLLAIDCGNTQTVIGLFNDHELVDHWRIATAADRTSDELALMFQQFLGFHGFSFDAHVSGVAIASGVPRVTAALREMTERYFGYEALVVEPGVRTGMPILYDEPKNVGADRIANAVGAYDLFGGPDDRRRLRHRQHRRRGEREGRVPRWRDLPRHRDLARRAVRARRRAAQRRAGRAEERDREVDDRGDPVGRGLRLQRPGRRASCAASRPSSGRRRSSPPAASPS